LVENFVAAAGTRRGTNILPPGARRLLYCQNVFYTYTVQQLRFIFDFVVFVKMPHLLFLNLGYA